MANPGMVIQDEVLGAALEDMKYLGALVGGGLLGLLTAWIPIFSIIIGIIVILATWKFVKSGTMKLVGYAYALVNIVGGLLSTMAMGAMSFNQTAADFEAAGGIWSLFTPYMAVTEKLNAGIFDVAEGQTLKSAGVGMTTGKSAKATRANVPTVYVSPSTPTSAPAGGYTIQ